MKDILQDVVSHTHALGFEPKYTVEKFLTNDNLGNILEFNNGETV